MILNDMKEWSGEIRRPVARTKLSEVYGYDRAIIQNSWKKLVSQNPGLHFILDLDENLYNTAGYWIDFSNRFLRMYAGVSNNLPSKDEVYNAGGPSNYYPKHFPQVFPSSERYEILADEMRHRATPNRAGVAMHSDMPWIFHELNNQGILLGGLTARPATAIVKKATEQQLATSGFPLFDVIYKPLDIPRALVSQEKLGFLEEIVCDSNSLGTIVLIDDSMSTANIISERNCLHLKKRPLIQILNASGPLTRPKMINDHEGKFTFNNNSGIFVMKDWGSLPETIENIKKWIGNRN